MEPENSPKLKSVVIITLPPLDNPSLGKTITAITVSAISPIPTTLPSETIHQNSGLQPPQIPSPASIRRQLSIRKSLFGIPRITLGFLGAFLAAMIVWASYSTHSLGELRNSNEERNQQPDTFVFPLFLKENFQNKVKSVKIVGKHSVKFQQPQLDVEMTSSIASKIDSTTILPIRGNIYPDGLYYTYMMIGNPAKPYFLDIDSASDLSWIQCDAPCTSCAKGAHPLYKPSKGTIIHSKDSFCANVQKDQQNCETCHQCDYEVEYADQSSSVGVLARDELQLTVLNGSIVKSNVVFGCAYDQQGSILKTLSLTDGIIGISRAKVSLPYQLAEQGIIRNVVGHCLSADAGGGGYMFFGDDLVSYSQMTWIPMLDSTTSQNFYKAKISKLSYGNKQLLIDVNYGVQGGVVFDSGSSYSYFPKQAYAHLVTYLKETSFKGLVEDTTDPLLPICWRAKSPIRSIEDVKQFFKTLTLNTGNKWWLMSTKFYVPPEGYLIISNRGNVCLGILEGGDVHDGSTIILGDISLRGQVVVYDNMNHKIGWAKSDCSNPERLMSLPFIRSMDLQS
ncbi:aspartyl protease APCB1-like [Impatiens glandulifera]|uniref:aspartyl protease APCB1-like n=1 Tax=Impatiens glandulifera TaxID=253017 RepID=UPI001FB073B6|nr:aspartyl protease APCB1-like [Impatiens glandulifera]